MKLYFLTDESEKSLAPFYSKPVLDTVLASTVIVAAFLLVFWLRRPLAEFIATGSQPKIFFLTFAATLIVNSYVNLCCGCGGLVRKGYHIISYQTDKATYEMEIDFYRYGMIEFLLHTLLLLLPFLPMLCLAAFSSAVSLAAFTAAVFVVYTSALFCRMSGFLVYLFRGRSSTLGYFAARAIMIFFIFATAILSPTVNPLQLLYRLNQSPLSTAYPFAIYTAVVLLAIFALILANNALVRRHINKGKSKIAATRHDGTKK